MSLLPISMCMVLIGVSPSLTGQTRDGNWKQCRDSNADVAIRGCNAVIELDQETNEYLAIAFNRLGNAYEHKKDYLAAIQSYNKALRLNSNFSLALNGLGNVYLNNKDYDKALQGYDEDIRLEPTAPIAYIHRGAAYMYKMKFDLAIRDFNEAIRLDPGSTLGFSGRATASLGKKDYDHALTDYETVTLLDPGGIFGLDGQGMVRNLKEDYDHAIQNFDDAIKLNPGDAIAFDHRGNSYRGKNDFSRAIEDYTRAVQLNPGFFNALDDRGFAEFHVGRFAEAESDFLAARKLSPGEMYHALWLYLAQSRDDRDGRSELEKNTGQMKLAEWPAPVVKLYLGKATTADVLSAATNADPRKDLEQHCEAYFYLAEQALLVGNRDEAKRLFQLSVDTGVKSFYEYSGSQAELKRLQANEESPAH